MVSPLVEAHNVGFPLPVGLSQRRQMMVGAVHRPSLPVGLSHTALIYGKERTVMEWTITVMNKIVPTALVYA